MFVKCIFVPNENVIPINLFYYKVSCKQLQGNDYYFPTTRIICKSTVYKFAGMYLEGIKKAIGNITPELQNNSNCFQRSRFVGIILTSAVYKIATIHFPKKNKSSIYIKDIILWDKYGKVVLIPKESINKVFKHSDILI